MLLRVRAVTKKPPPLSTAERIRLAATKERRSTLYRWMLANHDEFAAMVADAGRPNWQALAQAFADEGLRDLRENPPTSEGARQTWFKVRTAVQKERAKKPKQGPAQVSAGTTVKPPPAASLTSPDPTPAPVESTTASKADEQIARLKEHWRAQKSKMPDPL